MPTAMPMIPASASGVSITRWSPNSSRNPCVTRKTPPRVAMSSPSTTTRSSAAISSCRVSWIAVTTFFSVTRRPLRRTRAARGVDGSGSAAFHAASICSSTSALVSAQIASIAAASSTPRSVSVAANRVIGSRSFASWTSSRERYGLGRRRRRCAGRSGRSSPRSGSGPRRPARVPPRSSSRRTTRGRRSRPRRRRGTRSPAARSATLSIAICSGWPTLIA